MPIPTPFHERTLPLCRGMRWKDWAGYHAVCSFDTCHESEYYALRHACGMIDVSPLFKYEVKGPDASAFLSRVMTKNIKKLKVGQVTYCCWCDDHGKIVDDGTVTRMNEQEYRVTAAEPSYAWLSMYTRGYQVEVTDISADYGILSIQGPSSRGLVAAATDSAIDTLKFFRLTQTKLGKAEVMITRTGYTGDLGYEVWIKREDCLQGWDTLMDQGKNYGLRPAGLDAMDVTRIEAGFVMNGVDYFSAHHCLLESRKSSPYELGLGWTVNLNRSTFNGQAALRAEKEKGPEWLFRGIEMDWESFEEVCAGYGLPPAVGSAAWRDGIPLYDLNGSWIGYASSGAWSPQLKKNLALATLKTPHAEPGTEIQMEVTLEYRRHKVLAHVVETPFYNPERKRS